MHKARVSVFSAAHGEMYMTPRQPKKCIPQKNTALDHHIGVDCDEVRETIGVGACLTTQHQWLCTRADACSDRWQFQQVRMRFSIIFSAAFISGIRDGVVVRRSGTITFRAPHARWISHEELDLLARVLS